MTTTALAHDFIQDDGVSQQLVDLAGMDLEQLRFAWTKVYGSAPQPSLKRGFLARAIAYRIQTQRYGDVTFGRQERRPTASIDTPAVPATRLIRSWRGRVYEVEACDDGFLFEGVRYRSLTAVTKAITGTHWNGLTFFGVKDREDLSRRKAAHV